MIIEKKRIANFISDQLSITHYYGSANNFNALGYFICIFTIIGSFGIFKYLIIQSHTISVIPDLLLLCWMLFCCFSVIHSLKIHIFHHNFSWYQIYRYSKRNWYRIEKDDDNTFKIIEMEMFIEANKSNEKDLYRPHRTGYIAFGNDEDETHFKLMYSDYIKG